MRHVLLPIAIISHGVASTGVSVQILLNSSVDVIQGAHALDAFSVVELSSNPADGVVVQGEYLESISEIGQSRLVISTLANKASTDRDYFYAMGLAEGYLTAERIVQQTHNVVWSGDRPPSYVYEFLSTQYNYMREQSESSWQIDPYWFQVGMSLTRLDGIMHGLRSRQKLEQERASDDSTDKPWFAYSITYMDLYELNAGPELGEIIGSMAAANETVDTGRYTGQSSDATEDYDLNLPDFVSAQRGHCSALVKLVGVESSSVDPSKWDLLVAHNTWTSYGEMLRIYKTFSFAHVRHSSFAFTQISMASYPGYLNSSDDWMTLVADDQVAMVVTETTNECISRKRLRNFVVPGSVTTQVRSLVASLTSPNGEAWAAAFTRENSGTYNNQWMVVDYRRFREIQQEDAPYNATNVLWVVEQAPGLVLAQDMTPELVSSSYWASYNRPYFSQIAKVSGYLVAAEKHGEWYDHKTCPRAVLFAELQPLVEDISSMEQVMSSNRFNASVPVTCPKDQIAGRYDLDPGFGINSAEFFLCGPPMAYGAIDLKLVDSAGAASNTVRMQSGPLWGKDEKKSAPPFNWEGSQMNHWGQPEQWAFGMYLFRGIELVPLGRPDTPETLVDVFLA